jgi:hypothetical protein
MRRREFITLLGGAAAAWPLAARAQQPAGRVYRVGYFATTSRERSLHLMKAFEEGLRSLGWDLVPGVRGGYGDVSSGQQDLRRAIRRPCYHPLLIQGKCRKVMTSTGDRHGRTAR